MKVSVEFDLSNEEDRKQYQGWIKMKEITLNLEKLEKQIDSFSINVSEEDFDDFEEIRIFFNEMIWSKLG